MKIALSLLILGIFTSAAFANESFTFNSEKKNEVVITNTCSIKLNKVEQRSSKNSKSIKRESYRIFYDGNRTANITLYKSNLEKVNKDNYYNSLNDGDMSFFNKLTKNNVDIYEVKTKKGNTGYQIVASTQNGINVILTKNSFFYNTVKETCFGGRR